MNYQKLIGPIEESVRRLGATPEGVWADKENSVLKCIKRFEVMSDPFPKSGPLELLDVGCGPGLILDYFAAQGWINRLNYYGIDVSPMMIERARQQWPKWQFEVRDIVEKPLFTTFDYVILNGVFTSRCSVSYEEMEQFVKKLLTASWVVTKRCLCFNVMSTHVDWQRDGLFHWPIDSAVDFCTRALSRHIAIRADYGLYEYTVQVYREPCKGDSHIPPRW